MSVRKDVYSFADEREYMSVVIEDLSKRYGSRIVLKILSEMLEHEQVHVDSERRLVRANLLY